MSRCGHPQEEPHPHGPAALRFTRGGAPLGAAHLDTGILQALAEHQAQLGYARLPAQQAHLPDEQRGCEPGLQGDDVHDALHCAPGGGSPPHIALAAPPPAAQSVVPQAPAEQAAKGMPAAPAAAASRRAPHFSSPSSLRS